MLDGRACLPEVNAWQVSYIAGFSQKAGPVWSALLRALSPSAPQPCTYPQALVLLSPAGVHDLRTC